MENLIDMQRSVVQQEDTSETEGKCSHNCSSVVWCRDLGNDKPTRSMIMSE